MKSKALLMLIIAGFSFASLAQNSTDWENDALKGKVKSVKSTDYIAILKKNGDDVVIDKGKAISCGKKTKIERVETYNTEGKRTYGKSQAVSSDDSWLYSSVAGTKTYKYNKDGSLTNQDWQTPNYYYTWKTGSQGSCLERNTYVDGQIKTDIISQYDANGKPVAESSSTQNIVYKYDDNGNLTAKNVFDRDGKIVCQCTYQYEFDNNGNWIKRIERFFSSPVKITERTIEYY